MNPIETIQKKVIESLESNNYCVGLFVDLQKELDTINHGILSDKSSNNLNYKLQSACDNIFLWS